MSKLRQHTLLVWRVRGAVRLMRGYLWQNLREEVELAFLQVHPLESFAPSPDLTGWGAWHVEGETGDMTGVRKSLVHRSGEPSTPSVKALRDRRREAGVCIDCETPRDPKSKSYCAKHREADRLRAEKKRSMKLPDDRNGATLHFKILAREEEQPDGSATIKEVDGYLTLNLNPDGKTLRELFVRVGKAGASDALFDEWAKQASNRLQEGRTVEEVFSTHRHTNFGDSGKVQCVKGVTSCTSVLDLIAQVVLARFGTKEAS